MSSSPNLAENLHVFGLSRENLFRTLDDIAEAFGLGGVKEDPEFLGFLDRESTGGKLNDSLIGNNDLRKRIYGAIAGVYNEPVVEGLPNTVFPPSIHKRESNGRYRLSYGGDGQIGKAFLQELRDKPYSRLFSNIGVMVEFDLNLEF